VFSVRAADARASRHRRRPVASQASARLVLLAVPALLLLLAGLSGVPAPDADGRGAGDTGTSHAAPAARRGPEPAPLAPHAALATLDGRPARLVHDTRTPAGELDPATLDSIGKLQLKLAKKQAKLAAKEALLDLFTAELAAAQLELLAALSMPEGTAEELAAKQKAIQLATKKVAKKLKKVHKTASKADALEGQIGDLQDTIDELTAGDGGDPGGGGSGQAGLVSVPLLVQEVLPAGAAGQARDDACATFGIPFAEGEVGQLDGRPALAVSGADTWQFRTLGEWPDGSVQWALVDVVTDVAAGGINSALEITAGTGRSDGPDVAEESGNVIVLDTGVLQATVLQAGFNLFDTLTLGGVDLVEPHQSAGLLGLSEAGQLVVPQPSSLSVVVEENGPARAVVRVDGTLADLAGTELLDFTCRITARAGSADLQVDLTARNASIERPQHAVLEGLGLVLRSKPGASPVATLARHDGQQVAPLAPGGSAYLRQAYSSATTTDVLGTGTNYKPPIPKLDSDTLAEEGYEVVVDGVAAWPLGDKTKYPAHGWLDLNGATGGVTLSQKQSPYFWPACLEAYGNGDLVAGLWTARNPAPFVFCWRQHESRSVTFSFHAGSAPPPEEAARRLDWPVTGRAADYDQYDAAGVLPYRLLTLDEQDEAYALMGLEHQVTIVNDSLSVTRFLAAHNTGGPNNHDSIERRLGGEWLRHGHGGQWLNALDLALYKSEWQILRSDDFDHADDPGASNDDEVDHSKAYDGDLEHRYRDGMVLAAWLTGDPRLRDALHDEEEILATLDHTAHERSMYQTLRALAQVGRFTGSQRLLDELHAKLDFFLPPLLDVDTGADGFGWDSAPGQGSRRYYVNSTQGTAEKPPGENYITRGFISGSLGPLGLFHARSWLDPADPDAQDSLLRLTDLAFYTREELFPFFPDPGDRHFVYSWAVQTQQVVTWETSDFHPLALGMAEAFLATGDVGYLFKGIEQIEAFKAHDQGSYSDNMYLLDSRLDVQHFLAIWRDHVLGIGP
jgi:hypothetical protein